VTIIRAILIAFIALMLAPMARGQEKKPETVKLFNGKDMTGWVAHLNDNGKMEDVWEIKPDGVLYCKGKPNGYIRTDKDYTSYVLKLEWRFPGPKPGNSGALLRVQPPDKVWPKSIEAQLQHQNAGDFWNIDEFQMTVPPERTKGRNTKKEHPHNEKPLGEWNQYEITVDGPRVELKVNGLVQNVATECAVIPGKIALQSEGAPIEFRNIELTVLPDKGTGEAVKASTDGAVKRRLEGLPGWHVTGNGNWKLNADGVIEGKQAESEKSYTHVVSDKSYGDFKASLKFKCLAGNSGFYFRVKPEGPDENKMRGVQAEIDAEKNVGGLYESYGREWLSLPKPEVVKSYFKPQEWNEMTVEGRGQHVVVHVNGQKAGEIDDPTIRKEGPFALQIHGGQDVHVMFKDIKIESLTAE
jgi:hypothetical protein